MNLSIPSLSSRFTTPASRLLTCFLSTAGEGEADPAAGLFRFDFLLDLFRDSPEEADTATATGLLPLRFTTASSPLLPCLISTAGEADSTAGVFGFAFLLDLFGDSPEEADTATATAAGSAEEEDGDERVLRFVAMAEAGRGGWW